MKIYIVTCGSYSDYYIDKVFTDKDKAEEYRKWCRGANDVEVYDTEDDYEFKHFYKITVQYKNNDNGRNSEPTINVEKYVHEQMCDNYTSFSDMHRFGGRYVELYMVRYIPEEKWNEEFYRNKYTKAAYDLMAIARQRLFEGFTDAQITEMFNETYKE